MWRIWPVAIDRYLACIELGSCNLCAGFHVVHWEALDAVEVPVKNRLKVLRAEQDWSQAQLADFLDVSRQTINALETGKYDPSLPLAFKIAALFSLKIEDIFLANPAEKKE